MRNSLIVGVLVVAMIAGPGAAAAKNGKSPTTFKAEGSVLLANPTDLFDVGITSTEFKDSCSVPTATQGLDGYVIELPSRVSAVESLVTLETTSPSGVFLMDLFFFDSRCVSTGEILGSDNLPEVMREGTKYVLVANWFGDPAEFVFRSVEAR